jgi:hypothetical protein
LTAAAEVGVQAEPIIPTDTIHVQSDLEDKISIMDEKEAVAEVTPQFIIQLGPCGPIENQPIPMGLSLTQARFLSWAAIMHSKDIDKPKSATLSRELIEIVEDCPMVMDKGKDKRSLVEAEESEEK